MQTTLLLDAMCLVTTHTLLLLYRICYRVYTEMTNNKLYVKRTALLASQLHDPLYIPPSQSTINLMSRVTSTRTQYRPLPNTQSDLLCSEVSQKSEVPIASCYTLKTHGPDPFSYTDGTTACAPAPLQLVIKHIKLRVFALKLSQRQIRLHKTPDDPTTVNEHFDQRDP